MLRIFSILAMIFFASPVLAQDGLTIVDILSADTVRLSDGRVVMLGGIIAQPASQEYLMNNFKDKVVQPFPEDAPHTRYGEVIAHLKTMDGRWLQKELITSGLAHAFTMPSFRAGQAELIAAEKNITVLDANMPSTIDKSIKGFQIVEGVVVDVVERGKYVYINFGDDYKTDFTISMSAKSHKSFLEEGFDVLGLKGKRIRMRGWIDHYNGPFITLTYPEQIQIL